MDNEKEEEIVKVLWEEVAEPPPEVTPPVGSSPSTSLQAPRGRGWPMRREGAAS